MVIFLHRSKFTWNFIPTLCIIIEMDKRNWVGNTVSHSHLQGIRLDAIVLSTLGYHCYYSYYYYSYRMNQRLKNFVSFSCLAGVRCGAVLIVWKRYCYDFSRWCTQCNCILLRIWTKKTIQNSKSVSDWKSVHWEWTIFNAEFGVHVCVGASAYWITDVCLNVMYPA